MFFEGEVAMKRRILSSQCLIQSKFVLLPPSYTKLCTRDGLYCENLLGDIELLWDECLCFIYEEEAILDPLVLKPFGRG